MNKKERNVPRTLALVTSVWLVAAVIPTGAKSTLEQIAEFAVPEANQGVGVDARYFYAVDNQAIAKYDKKTGTLVKKWQGAKDGPIHHLDGALVMDGKLYAPH